MKEAQYYISSGKGYVTCTLCPNYCKIAPAREGRCGVRTKFCPFYGKGKGK